MAYNVVDELKKIYGLKTEWDAADGVSKQETNKLNKVKSWLNTKVEAPNVQVDYSGVENKIKTAEAQKTVASNAANAIYNRLRENGYSSYADKLSNMNAEQAKQYINNISVKAGGKQAIRPYMYNLGSKYGLSNSQIDKLINYDNDTQEVTFAGQLVGRADSNNIDGTTYWDTVTLDNVFNNYVNQAGLKTDTMRYDEGNNAVQAKLNEDWNILKSNSNDINSRYANHMDTAYGNVLETDAAKAVLAQMGVQGLEAYNNALASGAGANAGNVDSFATANANRAQLSKNAMGTLLAYDIGTKERDAYRNGLLDWQGLHDSQHTNRINNIDTSMTHNQQLFDNDQAAKANDVANNVQIAAVTGKVPTEFAKNYNQYYDENGNLKSVDNIDYMAIMNKAKEIMNSATATAAEREAARNAYNEANFARNDKIANHGYGQWADTIVPNAAEDIAEIKENQKDRAWQSSENQAERGHELDLVAANTAAEKDLYGYKSDVDMQAYRQQADIDNASYATKSGIDTNEYAQKAEIEAQYGTTKNNGTEPTLTAAQATAAIKSNTVTQEVIDAYNYYYGTDYTFKNPPVWDIESKQIVKGVRKNDTIMTEGQSEITENAELADYVSKVNSEVAKYKNSDGATIAEITKNSDGTYTVPSSMHEKVVHDLLDMEDNTMEDVTRWMEKLGIPERVLETVKNNKQQGRYGR